MLHHLTSKTQNSYFETKKATMIFNLGRLATLLTISLFLSDNVESFGVNSNLPRIGRAGAKLVGDSSSPPTTTTSLFALETSSGREASIWESLAKNFYTDDELTNNFEKTKSYTNTISLFRVGFPSLFFALSAKIAYPFVALALANAIDDSGVFAVVSQDASQYIQNVLTTSGLTFSILVGQTYYFMYQQQEAIYLALFEEVTMAKSLLEQVALVSQGREVLYERILTCVQEYVRDDLTKFNDIEPSELISNRPIDDPLEQILYLTSVGEPSLVYQTVRSLRQARSARLGALQRKLPQIQIFLLWTLAAIVLFTFPLLGAGSQTIGGLGILKVQSWYLSFVVFGISITMGVVEELRRPAEIGAYNAQAVLNIMVKGLEEELEGRLDGTIQMNSESFATMDPSVDSDSYYVPE